VPIVGETARSLLEYALTHAKGENGVLFRPWNNVRRDLHAACEGVKIRRCSPNDLRRTCATWLRAAGVSPELIAPVMGHAWRASSPADASSDGWTAGASSARAHADTRMVERVYGRLPVEDLPRRLAEAMGETTAAPVQQHPRNGPHPAHSADRTDSAAPTPPTAENQKARQTLRSGGPRCSSLEECLGPESNPALPTELPRRLNSVRGWP
jgi:hypothetical protein